MRCGWPGRQALSTVAAAGSAVSAAAAAAAACFGLPGRPLSCCRGSGLVRPGLLLSATLGLDLHLLLEYLGATVVRVGHPSGE